MSLDASALVTYGIAGIAVAVAVLAAAGYAIAGRAVGESAAGRWRRLFVALAVLALWMAVTGAAAASGALLKFDRVPPPMMGMMVMVMAAALGVGFSGVGERLARGLPLAALVGFQAFRLPLELVMHEAARDSVMPVQMSFSGMNFDIVTGASAVVVAVLLALGKAPRTLVVAWNSLGLVLVLVVASIGIASTPVFHAFGTEPEQMNVWIGYFPFVWLPVVMVVAAIAGHIVIARKLRAE